MSDLATDLSLQRNGAASSLKLADADSHRTIFFCLLAYLVVEFGRPQDVFPALAVTRSGAILGAILIVFSLGKLRDDVYKDKALILTLVFIALGVISFLHAWSTTYAYYAVKRLFLHIGAVVIPMCVLVGSETRLRKLIYFWIGLHVYLAVFGLLHAGRGPGGILADENDLALALASVLPFVYFLYRSRSTSKRTKLALLLAMGLIGAGMVATNSRGGFVGLAVTTAAIVWFSKYRLRSTLIVLVLGATFVVLMPSHYKSEIISITDTQDDTRNERLDSWTLAWRMFLDHPIGGVGFGNFPWTVRDYQLKDPEMRYGMPLTGRVAHSLPFTLLSETGIVGTVVVMLILVRIYRTEKSAVRLAVAHGHDPPAEFVEMCARAVIVSLLSILSCGAFISVLYYPQLWYAVGFSYVVHKQATALGRPG
jgi:hypothetical protein